MNSPEFGLIKYGSTRALYAIRRDALSANQSSLAAATTRNATAVPDGIWSSHVLSIIFTLFAAERRHCTAGGVMSDTYYATTI